MPYPNDIARKIAGILEHLGTGMDWPDPLLFHCSAGGRFFWSTTFGLGNCWNPAKSSLRCWPIPWSFSIPFLMPGVEKLWHEPLGCAKRTYNILKLITLTTLTRHLPVGSLVFPWNREPEVAPRLPLHPSLCMDCSGVLAITTLGIGPHWTTLESKSKSSSTISNTLSRSKCLLSVFIIAVSWCFQLVFWCWLATWSQGSYIFCASTPAPMGPLDLQFDRGGTGWFCWLHISRAVVIPGPNLPMNIRLGWTRTQIISMFILFVGNPFLAQKAVFHRRFQFRWVFPQDPRPPVSWLHHQVPLPWAFRGAAICCTRIAGRSPVPSWSRSRGIWTEMSAGELYGCGSKWKT